MVLEQALPPLHIPDPPPYPDQRGKTTPQNKKEHQVTEDHILLFNPQVSHYRHVMAGFGCWTQFREAAAGWECLNGVEGKIHC